MIPFSCGLGVAITWVLLSPPALSFEFSCGSLSSSLKSLLEKTKQKQTYSNFPSFLLGPETIQTLLFMQHHQVKSPSSLQLSGSLLNMLPSVLKCRCPSATSRCHHRMNKLLSHVLLFIFKTSSPLTNIYNLVQASYIKDST